MITIREYINNKFVLLLALLLFGMMNNQSIFAQSSNASDLNNSMTAFNKLLLSDKLDSALKLIKTEEKKAISDKKAVLAQIYYLYSKYYFFIENLDQAKVFAEKSLSVGQKSTNTLERAYGLYAIANYYYQMDVLASSFDNLKQGLALIDPNKYPDLANAIYYRLYCIYTKWDDVEETDNYAQKALQFALKSKNFDALSNAYSAKVLAMRNKFADTKKTVYNDSILYYLQKSVQLDYIYPDKVSIKTNAIANINLADYYFQEYQSDKVSFKTANDSILKYLAKVEKISSTMDRNFELRANSLGIKAQLALASDDTETAEKYLLNAYTNLSTEKKRPAFYTLYNVTIGLNQLYKAKSDYKKAYEFLGISQSFKDSIYNEDKIYEVHSLEAKYENEKIKEEVKFLETESKQRKIQNYLLLAVSLLTLSTLFFFYKNYSKKLKLQKTKSILLEKQNEAALMQVTLEKEKQALLSAERKILKVENEQMQKEAMVSGLHLERKNELLDEIRTELSSLKTNGNIEKSLKQDKKIEKSLNETVKTFEEINPVFFQSLKKQSDDKLTALDLKYCAYFHLGLSTKEISQVFHVEPKSIRMKKYRIKQKLGLSKEDSLESYFVTLEGL